MSESTALLERASSAFRAAHGSFPEVTARAPGRVNLIGEHTDYNDGFVLPMAIDREIVICATQRPERWVHIRFLDFDETISFDLDNLAKGPPSPVEYVKGVAHFLEQRGTRLSGMESLIAGNIPISAGLSSSAALELASARVFAALSDIPWDPVRMAQLALQAENRWVGLNCGIMDQLICAAGVKDHALLIDCRSLDTSPTPMPNGVTIIVLDTGTRRSGHGLVDSAYGERRMQCEQAAAILGVPALRDSSLEDLDAHLAALDPLVYKRAHHVITENARTLAAHRVMARNDPESMGQLMNASHESLQHGFEVSTPALDAIAEIARTHPACFGARMTGGGFGGCAVAAVNSMQANEFMKQVHNKYRDQTGLEPKLYACKASEGASLMP